MTHPPLPPTPEAADTKPSRRKLWIGGAAAAALTLGIAVPVMADSGDNEPRLAEPATSTVVLDVDEMPELDGDFDIADLDEADFDEGDFEELTAEDIEEINADTDALVAYLADKGVTVDVETDQDGLRFPILDDADDATWDLVDQYYEETYGDEWDEFEFDDFEDADFELTPEDIEEINAETDEIVAYLAENGVTVDVETDEDGVRWPVIDDEDDATWELVDQYFFDTYGEDLEMLEGCDFDEDHEFGDDNLEEDLDEDDLEEDEAGDELDDEDEGEA